MIELMRKFIESEEMLECISPLYRLERYKGDLVGKHEVLQTIIDILTNT